MKTWLILLMGLTLALAAACASGEGTSPTPNAEQVIAGTLKGAVTIGPLCPIEPCSESSGYPFSGRELVLQQPGGVVLQVPLQSDGTFEFVFPIGTYTVHMSPCEYLGCQAAFPVSVDIMDGETTTLNIDIDTGIRSPVGQSEAYDLYQALRATGVSVKVGGAIGQVFFSVPGQVLTIDGTDVQVFEYPGPAEAQSDADQVAPDGGSIGPTMITWAATPHFYRLDSVIVLYVGDDAAVSLLLEEALGAPFAEGDPAMTNGAPPEEGQDEETFSNLLTLLDVEPLLASPVRLSSEIIDY